MKTLAILLATMAALAPLPHKDTGDEKAAVPKKVKPAKQATTRKKPLLYGMHAQMAKVCGLSNQQQRQVAELNGMQREELKEFGAANGEKLKALKAKIIEARKNNDKEAVKEIYGQMRSILDERKEIKKKWQAKIMAVPSAEQKIKWHRYQITLAVNRRFKKAGLTDEQKAEVKAACVKFTTGADLADKEARRAIINKLSDYIRKEILTDAQREATTRPKHRKSLKVRKVKEAKKNTDDK